MTLEDFASLGLQAGDYNIYKPLIKHFKHEVQMPVDQRSVTDYDRVSLWTQDNIPFDDYVEIAYRYFFKHDFHAIQFKLALGF